MMQMALAGLASRTLRSKTLELYLMLTVSPTVMQAKFLKAFSRTALGFVISKKLSDWG